MYRLITSITNYHKSMNDTYSITTLFIPFSVTVKTLLQMEVYSLHFLFIMLLDFSTLSLQLWFTRSLLPSSLTIVNLLESITDTQKNQTIKREKLLSDALRWWDHS